MFSSKLYIVQKEGVSIFVRTPERTHSSLTRRCRRRPPRLSPRRRRPCPARRLIHHLHRRHGPRRAQRDLQPRGRALGAARGPACAAPESELVAVHRVRRLRGVTRLHKRGAAWAASASACATEAGCSRAACQRRRCSSARARGRGVDAAWLRQSLYKSAKLSPSPQGAGRPGAASPATLACGRRSAAPRPGASQGARTQYPALLAVAVAPSDASAQLVAGCAAAATSCDDR